jgi:carbon-monoxide dehydrogenase medium subunit
MIAQPFEYLAPDSIGAAVELISDRSRLVRIIGGGTMLVPRLTRGEDRPDLIVDPKNLGLEGIRALGNELVIGARATYDDVLCSELVRSQLPILKIMADGVTGGRSITGQGTLGGSACFGNPASDVPACLVALDARIRLVSVAGTREVPSSEFFAGAFSTTRRADEIAVAIVIPRPQSPVHVSYRKVKPAGSSWPILTVACVVAERGAGRLRLNCAIGGLAPRPVSGSVAFHASDIQQADQLISRLTSSPDDAWEDALADSAYRAMAAQPVTRRVFREAMERYHDR